MRFLSPGLVGGTLLGAFVVGFGIWLGFWQMDVWQAEREAQAVDRTHLEPVALTDVMGPDDAFPAQQVGRPVTLSGTWLDGGFWVEGRTFEGRDGYWAVSPFSVGGDGEPAILVVRGWSETTDADPDGQAPTGNAELTGWLQPSEGSMAVDDDPSDDVFPEVRVADAVQRVDVDLYTGYVVLHEEQLSALPEADSSTGLQNLLYAVEWWLFAAFAGYIWWRWAADTVIAQRKAEEGDDEGEDGDGDARDAGPSPEPAAARDGDEVDAVDEARLSPPAG
ncbi:MAG: SURF1 family protein [Nocardioides sp.]|uniref:SURF1 family protein n=1 Tax=Nocardioides sp. TaxID=35761 RepID=UPI003F033741